MLHCHAYVVACFLRAQDLAAQDELHALLCKRLLCKSTDFTVFRRQYPVQHLHHSHLGTHIAEETCELDADRT